MCDVAETAVVEVGENWKIKLAPANTPLPAVFFRNAPSQFLPALAGGLVAGTGLPAADQCN